MMRGELDTADRAMLEKLQRETFEYFVREVSPETGLVADKTEPGSPSSIAATGLGLSAYCVAVERGWMSRAAALERALTLTRFLMTSEQSQSPGATGYKGFYYHFLDMSSGRRAWRCELSTIDTALLLAGLLTVGSYFSGEGAQERELRETVDALYRRVDWAWACNHSNAISHGWTPERGFIEYSWSEGYSEALLLYVLALGSPTFSVDPTVYQRWTATFERKTIYGIDHVYAGPLFIHQLPQVWLDLRGLRDGCNRELGFDYFENSRRATLVQRQYGIENPLGFTGYSENGWGLTASDGPGRRVRTVDGIKRRFEGYLARGAPFGPDDGTLSPWAVVASLPFAPDVVTDAIRHAIEQLSRRGKSKPGFDASYNTTYRVSGQPHGWVSPWRFGLNEGPIVLMIEDHLSGLIWSCFHASPYVEAGLARAGFRIVAEKRRVGPF